MFGQLIPVLAVLFLAGLFRTVLGFRYSPRENLYMTASLVAHLLSALVQLWMVYRVYGVGDVMVYDSRGVEISNLFRQDFWSTSWQVGRMFLHQDYDLPIFIERPHPQTGTLVAIVGVMYLALFDSLVATALLMSVFSWMGKIALYEGLRDSFEARHRERLLVSTLLVPSVVFWSGGVVKEGVAIIGVGVMVLALTRLQRRRTPGNVLTLGAGVVLVALLKPHILGAMALAIGVWFYWQRAAGDRGIVRLRPFSLVVGMGVALGGIVLLGRFFPQFELDRLGQEMASLQFYGTRTVAGSAYTLGDPNETSLSGQLLLAPLGLFTALYRPLPFEVTNAQMAVNAVETFSLLGLTIYAFWQRSVVGIWRYLAKYPFLMFCLLFSLTFGAGVGLVSNSLGTLSRYRMPMVPFFATVVLIVSAPSGAVARRREPGGGAVWVRPVDRPLVGSAPGGPGHADPALLPDAPSGGRRGR